MGTKFLFRVENTFNLTGIGLALTPGVENNLLRTGNVIKLVCPDKKLFEAKIKAVAFAETHGIIPGDGNNKEDVPTGTEVWLIE